MAPFVVELDCYHGPLDLLLYLVKQEEVDVAEISIARITERFLEYIDALATLDLEEIGEFLILASSLMEIKSRSLLPKAPIKEDTEEEAGGTRTELIKQLLEYQRFKEASQLLEARAAERRGRLRRQAIDLPPPGRDPAAQPLRQIELWDLVSAFSRLLKQNVVPVFDRVRVDDTPIAVHQERLESRVLETGGLSLFDLLGRKNSRVQLVGKFLALLELIKSRRIWVEFRVDASGAEEIWVLPPKPELEVNDPSGTQAYSDGDSTLSLEDAGDPPGVVPDSRHFESEGSCPHEDSSAPPIGWEASDEDWADLPEVPSWELPEKPKGWSEYKPLPLDVPPLDEQERSPEEPPRN